MLCHDRPHTTSRRYTQFMRTLRASSSVMPSTTLRRPALHLLLQSAQTLSHEARLHSSATRLQLAHRLCISLTIVCFCPRAIPVHNHEETIPFLGLPGRFYYAAKQPVFHSPASLHSHVALNRMFMLFCGVVVRSHDHLASILALIILLDLLRFPH